VGPHWLGVAIVTDPDNHDDNRTVEFARAAADETHDDAKLQLFAEDLLVSKEVRETGRVRIAKRTVEREALVDENLLRERFEIETVPVGRRIDAMPAVRQEGDTTIVPVVEEVLYTERRLFLKEEVHIKLVRTTERYQETVVLRHQEAVVERRPNETENAETPTSSK
jgi:stress response protein YsnF